jgi:type II secretory pathway component PulM
MKGYWANLRPMEKRLVAGVGTLFFIVLNVWLVFPHFGDMAKIQARVKKANSTLALFEGELRQKRFYEQQVRLMESEGQAVPAEEQITAFARAIQDQQMQSGVAIVGTGKINTRTNQFFLEQAQTLSVQGKEHQLVDFLYQLGAGNSLMRVRTLTLHADPSHQQLAASVTVVASYQKNPRARGAVAVAAQTATPRPAPANPAPGRPTVIVPGPANTNTARPNSVRPSVLTGKPSGTLPPSLNPKK